MEPCMGIAQLIHREVLAICILASYKVHHWPGALSKEMPSNGPADVLILHHQSFFWGSFLSSTNQLAFDMSLVPFLGAVGFIRLPFCTIASYSGQLGA
jgi:hypothetical protein